MSKQTAQLFLYTGNANVNVNQNYLEFQNVDWKLLLGDMFEIGSDYILNLISITNETTAYGAFTLEGNGMVFHNVDLLDNNTEYKRSNRGTFPFFGTSGATYSNYGVPAMFKLTNQISNIIIRHYLQDDNYAYTGNAITAHTFNFDIYKINNI